jgi:hypothetical protein
MVRVDVVLLVVGVLLMLTGLATIMAVRLG